MRHARGFLLALLIASIGIVARAASAPASAPSPEAGAAGSVKSPPQAVPPAVSPSIHAPAAGDDRPPNLPTASFNALLELFVLAAILESALALLFNWRPFVARFDGRAAKPLISLIAAVAIVAIFKLDVIATLIRAFDATAANGWVSSFLTAMVIAGGSSGVNRLLRTLGVRPLVSPEPDAHRPPPSVSWLAVRYAQRVNAAGPVFVQVKEGGGDFATAGAISQTRGPHNLLLRDLSRLPTSGGLEVTPGVDVTVRLAGVDRTGGAISSNIWGPAPLRAGAIVDIDLTL